jgi:hypothetical protein
MTMNSFRRLRVAALLALGFVAGSIGLAIGQAGWIQIISPSGTEQVPVNSTGAFQNYVQLSTLRNTTGYQLSSSTSGTIAMAATTDNLILTAAVGTATVDLPASPPDATLAAIVNGSGSAFTGTITVATTDSSTIVGGSSLVNLASPGAAEYQYTAGSTKWYRVR